MASEYKSQARYYMATLSDGFAQFFPDLRRFIVMAKGKLGLKKSLRASEQDRPAVARRRQQWKQHQDKVDPKRLVFIDG